MYAVLEVAQNVFPILDGIRKFDATTIKLNEILKTVQRIEKKLDKLLYAPMQLAVEYFNSGVGMIKHEKFIDAFDMFNKVIDESIKAFTLKDNEKIREIDVFQEYINLVQITIFSITTKNLFDHTRKCFVPYSSADRNTKAIISKEIKRWIEKSINLKKKVKTYAFGQRDTMKEKEVQKIFNTVLKISYPYISHGSGLTNIHTDLSLHGIHIKLLPEYIPEGIEDRVTLKIGKADDRKFATISVWRDETDWRETGGRKDRNVFIRTVLELKKYSFPE